MADRDCLYHEESALSLSALQVYESETSLASPLTDDVSVTVRILRTEVKTTVKHRRRMIFASQSYGC